MNRRAALWLTMLMGGLAPARALAQRIPSRRSGAAAGRIRPVAGESDSGDDLTSLRTRRRADEDALDPAEGAGDEPPADFADESGRQWQTFDISNYIGQKHEASRPQAAIVDWIFRRTDVSVWHDDKIAALSASRTRVAAYHTKKILDQVSEVVERFTDSVANRLSLRVQVIAAGDTRWRYLQFARLELIGTGPQGQRLWTLPHDVATQLVTRMQDTSGFASLSDKSVSLVNGQTLTFQAFEDRPYNGSLQRDGGAAQGYQPQAEKLREGVELRISPLLAYDGDKLDAAIELTASTVRRLHFTKILAPREIGPNEATVEVPEVAATRLNQTVKDWPLSQTLLISAGVLPGILLPNKNGFLNLRLPGTMPTTTELLIFIRAEALDRDRPRRD